ncbi:MAG: haloacid dehalogenase-like hydrolase [Phyllobacteriaceae bacterium]|nr:haloacid dehalogenase-like hydrolase [Phyllobacteriaceae bacterium]
MKALCVFDLDGTLIPGDSFAQIVKSRILRTPTLYLTVILRVLNLISGEKFAQHAHRALLASLDPDNNPALIDSIVSSVLVERAAMVLDWKEKGAHVVLLSASPQDYVGRVGSILGFDESFGSTWKDGRYLHLHGARKRDFIETRFPKERWRRSFAIADSQSDMALLSLFEESILIK